VDETTRKKITRQIKHALLHGCFNENPDFKMFLKRIVASPKDLLDESDAFSFDNDACLTRCNGHCCSGTDLIRITPVDVDYIMKSGLMKGQTRAQVVKKTLDVFLGGTSRIPMATIRFLYLPGTPLRVCPFSSMIVKFFGGKNELKGICALGQKNKPTICMLFPLGRLKLDMDENKEQQAPIDAMNKIIDSKWIYFSMNCDGTKTAKKVLVKDFVGNIDEKNAINEAYTKTMSTIIEKLRAEGNEGKIDEIMKTMMMIFFYGEETTEEKLAKLKEMDGERMVEE